MADIPDRDRLERQYARMMARLLATYGGKLLEKLGDPPRLENLPADFWDAEAREMMDAVRPFGERVYLDAANRLLESVPLDADWTAVNERAAAWASSYTFSLVTGINDTSRQRLQAAVARYYQDTQTIGELAEGLAQYQEFTERAGRLFGPRRAATIAVTEVTRAAAEGERGAVTELAGQGVQMRPIWQTNNDELVCPLCGPRHGQEITDGIYPPIHPGDRCWVNHEMIMPETINA